MKPEREPLFRLQPCQHLALLLGVVLLCVVVWNFWLPFAQDFMDEITAPGLPPNVDFFAYYTAGQRFNAGANPYYYGESQPGHPLISEFIYPPTFLPVFGALARLPYSAARYLWLALTFLVYFAAFAALVPILADSLRLTFTGLGAVLTFSSFPLLFHIRNGQADMLVIGLVLLSFSSYTRGWRWISALLLAAAALLKVSPIFLLVFFVLYLRDWRFLLYTAVAGVAIGLLSLLVVPAGYYPDYLTYILPVVSSGTPDYLNQSLLKYLAGSPPWPQIVAAAGVAALAAYAAWAGGCTPAEARKLRAPLAEKSRKPLAVFILNLLAILVLQGKSWSMAYVWTILPAALLLAYLIHYPVRTWQLVLAGFATFLLVSKIYGYPPLDALNLFGALLMGALMVVLSWPGKTLSTEHGGADNPKNL